MPGQRARPGIATRVACFAVALLGCSSSLGIIEPDSGTPGDSAARPDSTTNAVSDAAGDTAQSTGMDLVTLDALADGSTASDIAGSADALRFDDGSVCGITNFDVHTVPSNVLILLDRSCSMQRSPTNTVVTAASGLSKWSLAASAIHTMTSTYASQVRWGLIYLPRSGTAAEGISCTGTAVCGGTTTCPEVAPAPATGTEIDNVLASGVSPFVGCHNGTQVAITPLNQGLLGAETVSQLRDATRSDYVMLITDGEETCVSQATVVATVTGLRPLGIRTAVVGFGAAGAGGVNPTELNAMANAGGLPASATTAYYAANDAVSLQAALTQIVGATISCTFALGAAPANASLLEVYANATTELPRDPTHTSGWDYDATTNSITLYGAACTDVRTLMYSQLDVIEACPGGSSPPPPPACHHLGQTCSSSQGCCNLEGLTCDTIHGVCVGSPE